MLRTMTSNHPRGMMAFSLVWFGQLLSLIGTGMTSFALALWAWRETGAATSLALVAFFAAGPTILFSPFAGALVDRWNRKLVMMVSDSAAGAATCVLLLLYSFDVLQIWHLYVAAAWTGLFQAFQWPSYSAAISTMLPPEQYDRANGMMSLAESASGIAAPLLAGVLIGLISIGGVMLLDILTFLFALIMVAVVRVPQPPTTTAGAAGRGSLWQESLYGFRYIWERPSLFGILLVFLALNLTESMTNAVRTPMILARTNDNAQTLGIVTACFGVGGVVGGLVMSIYGGPKRRVYGVLSGMVLGSILGTIVMGVGRALPVWMLGAFFSVFFFTTLNGSNQALWQAKVALDVQGRVFAVRRLIAQISVPLALVIVGPLADQVFERAMQVDGALAPIFGSLVGTGPGAGMAVMMLLGGVWSTLVGLSGFVFPAIRNADVLLPDQVHVVEGADTDNDVVADRQTPPHTA